MKEKFLTYIKTNHTIITFINFVLLLLITLNSYNSKDDEILRSVSSLKESMSFGSEKQVIKVQEDNIELKDSINKIHLMYIHKIDSMNLKFVSSMNSIKNEIRTLKNK